MVNEGKGKASVSPKAVLTMRSAVALHQVMSKQISPKNGRACTRAAAANQRLEKAELLGDLPDVAPNNDSNFKLTKHKPGLD